MVGAFTVVTAIGTATSLGLAALGWRARSNPGGRPLVTLTLAIAVWDGSFFLATLTPDPTTSIILSRLHFVGLTLVVPSTVALVLEYGGREEWLTRRTVGLLLIEPVVVNALVWTPQYHDLFLTFVPARATEDATEVGNQAVVGAVPVDPGPVFWLHAAYTWLLAAVALVLVVRWALDSKALHRRQFGLVAVGIAVPLVASILDNTTTFGVRLTEPAFVVTGIVLTVAVVAYDFTDVTPIARQTVFDDMSSAVLVVDDRDRLVDLNDAAVSLLDVDRSAIGSPLADALDSLPAIADRIDDLRDETETVVTGREDGTRALRIDVTTLEDARESVVGRSVLVQDVTAERQRRRELERQNEHLEQFASLVSHDLRNPLEVARGRLEIARETGNDEHLETVAESHDRMADIIDDVLTLAREGQRIEETERLALGTVADDAWESVRTDGATFHNGLRGTVTGDYSRLRRVFENLFRNASDHSENTVTVRAGLLGADAEDTGRRGFYVADDGPGIPEAAREQIFETGYSDGHGTGLGLSIIESLVRGHGWQIAAVESGDGGARFEVTGITSLRDPSGAATSEGISPQ